MKTHHEQLPISTSDIELNSKLPYIICNGRYLYFFSEEAVRRFRNKEIEFKKGEESLLVAVHNLIVLQNKFFEMKVVNNTDIEIESDDIIEVD